MIPTVTLEAMGESPDVAVAMASHGCCFIENAFPVKRVNRLLQLTKEALALPERLLLRHRRTHNTGGYVPPGMEYVKGDSPKCRTFDLVAIDHGKTAFPPTQFLFEVAMRVEYLHALAIASYSLRALDAAWDTSLEKDAYRGPHMLRALSYAPQTGSEERFPEHRDFGLITLFAGESAPGLECLIGGAWTPIAIPRGTAFLIAGTTLRLYHKSVRPLAHRVLGGTARTSLVQFIEARGDVVLPGGERAADRFARRLHGALRVPS